MKNKILSACFAALALAACDEPKKATPISKPTPPPRVVVAPQPIVDAGMMSQVEPKKDQVDVLGIAHDHRGKIDHLARAEALKTQGEPADALTEARLMVYDNPANEKALQLIGKLAKSAGQKDLAAAAFGRLGALNPDDAVPLVQQARVLVTMGEHTSAIAVGSEAITRDPSNPEGYQVVGRAHLSKGELQSAIGMFEKAVELQPEHGYALNNLGFAYLRANEDEKAVEALVKASELLPHVAYIQNNLGVAYERTGQIDEAKLAYAKSTSLSPKYVKARVNAERVAKASQDAMGTETDAVEPDTELTPSEATVPTPEIEMPEE